MSSHMSLTEVTAGCLATGPSEEIVWHIELVIFTQQFLYRLKKRDIKCVSELQC